ncbi:MAG TPA: acyl-CoA dehydrogenase family protein, partial [Candidatus Binatia bacterium]|nr:acyl-CoA dehydrogenase family protein [Candidatus Binatia bacterium]
MDLSLSAEHLRFRDELRSWLAANLARPWREEIRDPRATVDGLIGLRRAFQRKLNAAGYLGLDWPKEWGGRGATAVEKAIFEAEMAGADAPPIVNFLGIGLCGPALIH